MNARLTRHAYSNDISNLTIVARVRRDGIPQPRRRLRAPPAAPRRPRGSRSPPRPPRAGRAARRPPPRGRGRRRRRCASLARRPAASLSSLSIAFASRSRSAAMSMTSASGRQKVAALARSSVTAPFGASAARLEALDAGEPRDQRRGCAPAPRPAAAARSSSTRVTRAPAGTCICGADRADLLDQPDHPVHLGVGGGVDQLGAVGRPVGVGEQLRPRRRSGPRAPR